MTNNYTDDTYVCISYVAMYVYGNYMYKQLYSYTSERVIDLMMDKSGPVEGVTSATSEKCEDTPPPYSAQSSTDQLMLTEMCADGEGKQLKFNNLSVSYTHS